MAHPNEELVRKGYDAFASGDMDTLRELFDPEIVWHFPGRSPLAGDHRGPDAVLGFFGRTMELTTGTFRAELHDVVADDRHTVRMHLATGEREGRTLEDRESWSSTSATAGSRRSGSTSRTSTPTTSSSPRSC
jgi:ketosteroid isomerase-like protein